MYEPVVDDYVKWKDIEGWVYYKGDEYITIEVAVKDKPKCEYTLNEKHKKIHTLVVCQTWYCFCYIRLLLFLTMGATTTFYKLLICFHFSGATRLGKTSEVFIEYPSISQTVTYTLSNVEVFCF